ncbi:COG3650 family protein [Pseudomonas sp. NA-150]|uniref:COG3650 family protein n=1 Tax=Pseudomonas sp. NA-150 TaxID=3367525 RepID=UPI0037C9FBAB
MFAARSLLMFALLPIFAGCQMFSAKPENPNQGLTRMQGQLTAEGGQLWFQPCNSQRRFSIIDNGNTGVLQEAGALAARKGALFADLRGGFVAGSGMDGQVNMQQLYRVERSATACNDANFKKLLVHASGTAPAWAANVNEKGMVLSREGKDSVAFPYVEEQLPDGRLDLSTEANGQRIELWVAPQRCVDPVDGSVQHLTAELRVNGQVQRGCAYYGGARND